MTTSIVWFPLLVRGLSREEYTTKILTNPSPTKGRGGFHPCSDVLKSKVCPPISLLLSVSYDLISKFLNNGHYVTARNCHVTGDTND